MLNSTGTLIQMSAIPKLSRNDLRVDRSASCIPSPTSRLLGTNPHGTHLDPLRFADEHPIDSPSRDRRGGFAGHGCGQVGPGQGRTSSLLCHCDPQFLGMALKPCRLPFLSVKTPTATPSSLIPNTKVSRDPGGSITS